MVVLTLDSQLITQVSTLLLTAASALLSIFITMSYYSSRSSSMGFWSIGMWLFTLGAIEEVLFSFNMYSQSLIKSYLAIVAILVLFLGMGSIQLAKNSRIKIVYYAFSVASALFLLYSLLASSVGYIISSGVVFGPLPAIVVLSSSVMTFPAAIVIIAMALLSYRKSHSRKMLSIIIGVIIVSVAGTLYIAQFPAFLYFAEFLGILLLWRGFFDPRSVFHRTVTSA